MTLCNCSRNIDATTSEANHSGCLLLSTYTVTTMWSCGDAVAHCRFRCPYHLHTPAFAKKSTEISTLMRTFVRGMSCRSLLMDWPLVTSPSG